MKFHSSILFLLTLFVIVLSRKKLSEGLTLSKAFSTSREVKLGEILSFQSTNYPTHYLRHRNFELWLDQYDNSDLYKKDSSFKVVNALNGKSDYISFESVNYPGYYMRHSNYLLYINQSDGSDLFKNDASFKITAPINGMTGSAYASIQTSNYPNYYIRHQNYRGKIDKKCPIKDRALYNNDASWKFVKGNILS